MFKRCSSFVRKHLKLVRKSGVFRTHRFEPTAKKSTITSKIMFEFFIFCCPIERCTGATGEHIPKSSELTWTAHLERLLLVQV